MTITVAKQMLSELPDQKGRTYDQAVQQLSAVGFTNVARQDVDSDQPKDTVIDMTPQGGTDQPKDVQVTLKVSKGPQQTQVQIPADIGGKQFKDVKAQLEALQLVVVQSGSDKEDAMVMTSTPAPGSMVNTGETVTVITVGGTGGDQGGNPGGNPGGDQGGGGFFD